MKHTAIQIGAGNIGRGFIAQLFHESGLEVVFIDVVQPVVDALNFRKAYTISIVGPDARDVPITKVRAVDGRDKETAAVEISECEVACTAVGAGALKFIAPYLAAGLLKRYRDSGSPLNVIICENLHDASDRLRHLVSDCLPEEEREAVLERTGFVQAVVSRMVPLQPPSEDPLAIKVESYKRLPIDAHAIVGAPPILVGVEPVDNFEAHVERKLYTHNCAHATLGYLGWRVGLKYGYEALKDPCIRSVLDEVMKETGRALTLKHGFDPEEHAAHVANLVERFANVVLGDTCFRLARDPIRKLAFDDRLTGAARLCEGEGIEPKALSRVIACALQFDAKDDPSAMELQRCIADEGAEKVLFRVCGIDPKEPLGAAILASYYGDE